MPRLLDDWLTSYLEFTKNTEPPISYHTWAGLSVISSALQRKVLMKWGHSKIYANQYIILVGPSGTARKGDAIAPARSLMEHISISIASQSITREKLIRVMAESVTSYSDKNKNFTFQAPVSIISAELSVFAGQKNIKLLADLTDLYDAQDSWTYETKHGDKTKDIISGVCVNILGATAPDWIPTILPQEAIGGGWTSRVIFIVEEGKGQVVANPNITPPDRKLEKKLQRDLEKIHLIIGEYEFTNDALDCYVAWYEDQEEKLKMGIFPIRDIRFGGYVARRATHIKKLAMCLSASKKDELEINLGDFERAIKLLEKAEIKMTQAFKGMGKSDLSEIIDKVLNIIIAHDRIKRSEVLRFLYGDIDVWTLEQVEKVLVGMKVMKPIILNEEDDAIYVYTKPREI